MTIGGESPWETQLSSTELSSLPVNVPGTRLELNIASKTNGGQFADRAYSMEMIYSSSDIGYHSRDKKTWQPGTGETRSSRAAGGNLAAAADENGVLSQNVFTFYFCELRIYFDQTRSSGGKKNRDQSG